MTTRKTVSTPALNRSEVLMLVALSVSIALTVGAGVVALVSAPTNPLVWGLLVVAVASLALTIRLMVRNLSPRR